LPNSRPDFDADELELSALHGQPPQACPPVNLLLAQQEGALPPELAQRIQQHLDRCPLCPAPLADLATLPEAPFTPGQEQRIAARLPSTDPRVTTIHAGGPAHSRRHLGAFAAIAAAVIVCITVGSQMYLHRQAASTARNAPPPIPSAPPPTIAAIEIPLAPLAPPGNNTVAPLTRGAHGAEPSIDELLPAFDAYNAADYTTAAKRFTALKKDYPHSEIVLLYLGVSQLFLHQDADAGANLTLARRTSAPNTTDAAEWYSAIAAQRLHSPEVKTLLDSLCKKTGSKYSAESCRIVPTLP
jgi:hypothetical protein